MELSEAIELEGRRGSSAVYSAASIPILTVGGFVLSVFFLHSLCSRCEELMGYKVSSAVILWVAHSDWELKATEHGSSNIVFC